MKKLFQAIRKGDLDEVRRLLEQKPSLVNCTAKQPPKKDDGQSPLQVAIKTHQFAIANELLDRGADVNFMEDPTICCDDWCMPVLHIAAMVAVNCCRHNSQFDTGEQVYFTEHSTAEAADESYALLQRLLAMGADVNACESRGTTLAERVCRSAADLLPQYHWNDDTVALTAVVTPEWRADLGRIFTLLRRYGTDFSGAEVQHYLEKPNHPLVPFLQTLP